MGVILYTYKDGVYVNLTNRCSCNCRFCVRTKQDSVNGEDNMWHEKEPTISEVIAEIDQFDFTCYNELIYCGYGEPTCAFEALMESAKHFKKIHHQKIRVNTNGLGRLYNGRDILPDLNEVVDAYSISLNAPNAARYDEITRPMFENGFDEMIRFAKDCKEAGKDTQFSAVTYISENEIEECRRLSQELGIRFKVRTLT